MKISTLGFGFPALVVGLLAAGMSFAQAQEMRSAGTASAGVGKEGVAYAVMNGSNSIAIIDIATKKIIGMIRVEGNPHGGAITPDGGRIYTASMGSEKIFVVDTRARRIVKSIAVGGISHHSAISPDGRYIYVASDQLIVIDSKSDKIVARIDTKEPPFHLEFSPDGRSLYVLNIGSTITIVDPATNTATDTIRMGGESVMGHLAFHPDGRELYATNDADDAVSVIDTSLKRTIATIQVGRGPHGVATTRDGKYLYVANRGETTFSVIDTSRRSVIATYQVGERPEHISLTPDGKYVFLGINTGSDRILVIDPPTSGIIKEIHGWPAAHAFLFHQPKQATK